MPSIAIWQGFEFAANDGSIQSQGSLDVPGIIPASAAPVDFKNSLSLAQNASGLLWDASTGPSDFTVAWLLSDTGDATNGWMMVEFTTDEAGTFGTEVFTMALMAGVPLPICSSSSFANYTVNFAGGTLSKIQKIRAKNLNSATATVSLRLVL